ncbi:hypothetical protein HG535_0A02390 [Zygotorulaspora mrakii]|uniref:Anaphase-promoting complex subunit 4-like WD40 domain-containing protein n=1 Tax=Zygotorulaspora mrakii TaxID=42260 RepID=A0A7H9AVR8_ZYGMR|nr:uncharacterized protein HG535_0A02390 [Zygotorulaspora mrakii]QLG70301.1 hypothetical protein HG535_0A02390 [Zygotorulaspora mrakii]
MSITSEELNYLIWRYLQETGNEVSALALQDDTRVLEFDRKYKQHIPLGTLVNLVQKGILFCECELLVDSTGKLRDVDETHYASIFNLAQALEIDKATCPEVVAKGRFSLENDYESLEDEKKEKEKEVVYSVAPDKDSNTRSKSPPLFIKTLKEEKKLGKIVLSSWNPHFPELLAVGGQDSLARIIHYNSEKATVEKSLELRHPFAFNSSSGITTNQVTCLAWSPDGKKIVTGVENGELRLWNAEGHLQNVFSFHRSPIVSIKWNEDDSHFLTSDVDNVAILWNVITGTALQNFELKENAADSDSLGVDLEWVEKDKFVLPGIQGSLIVYQIGERKPIGKLIGHQGPIGILKFNRNKKLLLSASDDFTLRVWRGGSSNPSNCFYGHSQTIVSACWLDDDKIISSSMDGSIRLWSLSKNTLIAVTIADGVPILSAELSSDKKKYSAGFIDGHLIVYDVEALLEKLGNDSPISPITFPVYGSYQSPKERDCIFNLSWNYASDKVVVAYSIEEGSIISM